MVLHKKVKSILKLGVFFLAYNIATLGGLNGWASPFYRVKQEYGIIYTEVDGDRKIDDKVGYHWRFWGLPNNWIFNTKELSKRVEYIFLDDKNFPHEMQAKDFLKFQGRGVWTYRIVNLEKFGIKMGKDALNMLKQELDGIAKPAIQSKGIEEIVTNMEQINNEVNSSQNIKKLEQKYGIEIISFALTHATYPKEMNEKTAQAKAIRIMAEAEKEAAVNRGEAWKTLGDADEYRLKNLTRGSGVESEEGKRQALETLGLLKLAEVLRVREGENTYIFTDNGKVPNLTLPSKEKTMGVDGKEKEKEKPIVPYYKKDKATGWFIDPATGFLIDPETGKLIAPNTLKDATGTSEQIESETNTRNDNM